MKSPIRTIVVGGDPGGTVGYQDGSPGDLRTEDNVTYIISIVNSGQTAFTGATLEDDLGEYDFGERELTPLTYIPGTIKYYIDGVLQPTPVVTAGPPLTVSGPDHSRLGNAIVVYEAELNSYAPLGVEATITNTAVITANVVTPITVRETINAEEQSLLTITKSVSPVPVTENGTLTYTFVIQNLGNTAATEETGVVITDTFNPVLKNLTATFNGTAWTEGADYTYDEITGMFASVAGKITVPAATYTQDTTTGAWGINPGVSTLVISGTV